MVRQLDTTFDMESDHNMLNHVIDYYHETLKNSPQALKYLKRRGINKPEAIDNFKLGFSDRSIGLKFPENNRKKGAQLRGQLQRLGVLKDSGHEQFRGSVVFPVINQGMVQQAYGRKINKLRPGTPNHVYLNEEYKGLFNIDAVKICEELIICQSIIDALTFWCADFKNVTCSYGLDGFTDKQLDTLTSHNLKRVLIAYQGDKSGDTAANALAEILINKGIECYRIEFSDRMDANAYALSHTPAYKSLGELIREAAWMGKASPEPKPNAVSEPATQASQKITDKKPIEESVQVATTVLPAMPDDIEAEIKDDEIILYLDERRYRIRGLEKNLCYDQLKVNILVNKHDAIHVDVFDLYASRARNNFIKQTALELSETEDTLKQDLSRILLKLEVLQAQNIHQAIKTKPLQPELSKKEQAEAMSLLQSPKLMQRILDDFQCCGVVGEKTNKLVGYLAALSRKLDKPLAIMIQSTSASGKSALMDAVLSFMPVEERVQYSAMTGQSLFYMGDINLKHKILAICEEEGASHATYALKLLQSDGQLTIASTGKDPDSGRHVTREYKVEGPVMIFSTTTAIDIDEELLNRCLVLTVDEDRKQTQAIHDYQRYEETLEGLLASQAREDILRVHRNAQRLLKPLKVVNPYATQLTFLDDKTRTRRDHKKYLTLIRSIALLHQYQRELKSTYLNGKQIAYIEVTVDDIAMANQLAHEVLGRSLDDMPPQTQRLLMLVDKMVKEECASLHMLRQDFRFSRRDIRAYTGWGDTQLKVHLKRLEEMEYLLIHQGGRGKTIIYELLYNSEGKGGQPFLMGLIDVETLKDQSSENTETRSVSSQSHVGTQSPLCQKEKYRVKAQRSNLLEGNSDTTEENVDKDNFITPTSYRNPTSGMTQGGHQP
jgi:hypothetical protein